MTILSILFLKAKGVPLCGLNFKLFFNAKYREAKWWHAHLWYLNYKKNESFSKLFYELENLFTIF